VPLLEAGPVYQPRHFPAVLADTSIVGGDARHDWGYMSESGDVGHPIHAIRGKVIGGSSAVNGSVALRARPTDFLHWSQHGDASIFPEIPSAPTNLTVIMAAEHIAARLIARNLI
jgi:choline dehydrogenase-like flavoprotein